MSLKTDAAVYNYIGDRGNNEDNFFFNGKYMSREQMNKGGRIHTVFSDKVQVFAVCDGMGGAEFGEEASLKAVEALKRYQKECVEPDNPQSINLMIDKTSREIDDIAISHGMRSGSCGSTVAMLIARESGYCTVNVGDSRIYRLRGGHLDRLTKDDSAVQLMLDCGQITQEQAWRHPRGNVILKHLGMPLEEGSHLTASISERQPFQKDDRFLICSDGVTDTVQDEQIQSILLESKKPEQAADKLIEAAMQGAKSYNTSSDNITAIVLDIKHLYDNDSYRRKLRLVQLGSAITMLLSGGMLAFFLLQFVNILN